jgi:GNAT superfamily N-acetyltransferase
MNVRNADKQDLAALVDMGAKFHAVSPVHQAIPFDYESFYRFCDTSLDNPDIGFWVADQDGALVGMTAAIVYPAYFNAQRHIAQELFWWVDAAARGAGAGKALVEAIEKWAQSTGADAVFMLALADKNEEKMHNLYARRGYRPLERTFIKEVL